MSIKKSASHLPPDGRAEWTQADASPPGKWDKAKSDGEMPPVANGPLIDALRQELKITQEHLQAIIREHETTRERLEIVNEELRSGNEEMQGINAALEATAEQLQKTNEELSAANQELYERNVELDRVNDDLSNLLSSTNIPILMLGSDLRVRRFTPLARKVWNLSLADIGQPWRDVSPNISIPDLPSLVSQVMAPNSITERELQDREGRWYSMRVQPYKTREGKIDGAVITLLDIDTLKRSLEALRKSREKEVLLNEIQHRVKNNLQIIISLLKLQSSYIKNKEAREAFRESQGRIKSMSLIHELLYRSKDLARIDFAEYIGSLTTNLLRAYGANPSDIKCRIEVDNVSLNVDTAIPCGLIINELVSNCLKHAFPDGPEGEICIRLHADGDNRFTLVISDNGIGLPKDFDVRNTQSLGLQLVDSLARQLSGTVELNGKGRTEFKITFAEVKRKDRTKPLL